MKLNKKVEQIKKYANNEPVQSQIVFYNRTLLRCAVLFDIVLCDLVTMERCLESCQKAIDYKLRDSGDYEL